MTSRTARTRRGAALLRMSARASHRESRQRREFACVLDTPFKAGVGACTLMRLGRAARAGALVLDGCAVNGGLVTQSAARLVYVQKWGDYDTREWKLSILRARGGSAGVQYSRRRADGRCRGDGAARVVAGGRLRYNK